MSDTRTTSPDDPTSAPFVDTDAVTRDPPTPKPDTNVSEDFGSLQSTATPPDSEAATFLPPLVGLGHPLHIGDVIDGYTVERHLASGGMGHTYIVKHRIKLVEEVLKVIRPELADSAGRMRFESEIRTLANVKADPRVVPIHYAGTHMIAGVPYPYLVMPFLRRALAMNKYIDGHRSDPSLPRRPKLRLRGRLELFVRVCEAVQALHEQNPGLVHLDLKPSNIVVDEDTGEVKILDFGIAKWARVSGAQAAADGAGSLGFAAPEQFKHDALVSPRTDIHALGHILRVISAHHYERPTIRRIVEIAKAEEPTDRYEFASGGGPTRSIGDAIAALLRDRSPAPPTRDGKPVAPWPFRERAASVVYRARHWGGVAAVLLATSLAQTLGVQALYIWTPAHAAIERLMKPGAGMLPASGPLANSTIVAITDATERLLTDNSSPDVIGAVGRLDQADHRPLLESLLRDGAKLVFFDMRPPARADELKPLIQENYELGGTVVFSGLWSDSPPQSAGYRFGPATAQLRADMGLDSIAVDVVLQTPAGIKTPSGPLWMWQAAQRKGPEADLEWNYEHSEIVASYWKLAPGKGREQILTGTEPATARLRFTNPDVITTHEAAPEIGIHEDDRIGYIEIPGVPADEVMKASTIDYADIVSRQQAIKANRAVVVIDARTDCADRHELRDGRVVPGGYLQAAAVEALLSGRWLQRPTAWGTAFIVLGATTLAALATCRGHRRRAAACWAGACALVIVACFAGAHWGGYIVNPAVPLLGMIVSGVVGRLWSVYTGLWRNWYGVPST
ncbi:MAG: protein kinase [Planctomycetes bacterium]|nr:protein kinase [Planctomycetota bacterium]